MNVSGKPDLIRRYNQDLIRDLIISKGPITKVELARLTGASIPTVNKIVNLLEAEGLVCRDSEDSGGPGRKAVRYVVNGGAGCYIGFFIQNGKLTARLADFLGNTLMEESCTPDFSDPYRVICGIIDRMTAEIPQGKLNAIGLGIPGVIGFDNRISSIPTMPSWEGADPVSVLKSRYNVPVFIENDVKLMTVGVYNREFSDRFENMVLIYVSGGLGAGIILNGHLYRGFSSFAGEYGFMVVDGKDRPSASEWTGELETTLCPIALKAESGSSLSPEEETRTADLIAAVATNFITVLNPELISFCGAVFDESAPQSLQERIRRNIPGNCMPEFALTRDQDYGINGVIDMCIAETTSKLSLIDRTGL